MVKLESATIKVNIFRNPMKKKAVKACILSAALILTWVCGLVVGHHKWLPFSALGEVRSALLSGQPARAAEYLGDQELLQYAFTDPVHDGVLYYPPITSLTGIHDANERIFMERDGFKTAYNTLIILDAEQIPRGPASQPVVRVSFSYQGRVHEAFAYGTLPSGSSGEGTASLIIPGSGLNQSLSIAQDDPKNYHHGIMTALKSWGGDIYIFIKPNEDFLAWHDGNGHKLSGNFIWNYHLNRGGSYSVSYLVQTMAMTKYLKANYEKTVVAGLSQGGAATLINALQTHPTLAIVASGYSVINDLVEWSGHNQIIGVPGYGALNSPDNVRSALKNTPTEFLFTFGRAESGTYRIEAEEGRTAKELASLANIEFAVHDKGHVFPTAKISAFLQEHSSK